MNTIEEIKKLEEQLRQAELGPDPNFFETHLSDEVVLDGKTGLKPMIVAAHTPGSGKGQKFTSVEMSDLKITDHGTSAIVTITGTFTTSEKIFTMKFMRVWMKKKDQWQIIAGSTLS